MAGRLPPLGPLFPLGGPVPSNLVIGRTGEIDEIAGRLREGMGTLVAGPRRIGKTTVCDAVCQRLGDEQVMVIKIDVPERKDSGQLLQQIVNSCTGRGALEAGKDALRILRPVAEKLLKDQGVPLDLSAITAERRDQSIRTLLGLPIAIAEAEHRRALVFFDELQRVADYDDGHAVLTDIMDLYANTASAVVLVDGSDERTLGDLLGPPIHFGKLVDRVALPSTISAATWRAPLTDRFAIAGLRLDAAQRDQIIAYGAGRPYETMAVARYTASSARKLHSDSVTDFDVQMGIDEARRRLDDDGA